MPGVIVDSVRPRRGCMAHEQVVCKRADIRLALAQWGQVDLESVERKKRSSRNSSLATISRRSRLVAQSTRTSTRNGSFSPTFRISPDSRNRKQLDLDALVELADFVEEERTAVGDFEEPLAVGIGAGEGTLAMAE